MSQPYYLSVFAMLKNEAHIIVEWVEHHLAHGVDHLYLVDDGSTDNFHVLIAPYVADGTVTVYQNDVVCETTDRQCAIYRKFAQVGALRASTWLAFIDLDEFLWSPGVVDVKQMVRRYDDEGYDQLRVPWLTFGANGHMDQPNSVVTGFTMRAVMDPPTKVVNHYLCAHKCIMKCSALTHPSHIGIHEMGHIGYTLTFPHGSNEPLMINHYRSQSESFWRRTKMTRGDNNRWKARDMVDFNFIQKCSNKVVDTRLFDQNTAVGQ
jgi:hypothetical protein